jgi:hypothetical protein
MAETADLFYFVGTAWGGDPARLSEFNEWYDDDHLPMMVSMPGIYRGDRYEKISGDDVCAPYVATYNYEDFQAYEAYKVHPLRRLLKYAGWERFPNEGEFIATCHVAFNHLAGYDKDIVGRGETHIERVIQVVGINFTDLAREEEFNRWYDDVNVPALVRHPGMVRADRYRRAEKWDDDRNTPEYLTIYEFKDLGALKDYEKSGLRMKARDDRAERFPEGVFERVWMANYRRLGTWRKPLV